jgi:hypothetical protein
LAVSTERRQRTDHSSLSLDLCLCAALKARAARRVLTGPEEIVHVMTLAPGPAGEIAWLYVMRNPDKLQAV